MSRKFLVPIDLSQNELQNPRAQNLASAPGSPVVGQFYYDTTTGRFVFRGASAWIDPTDRTTHTGTQLASTISNFDTQVRTSRLDQMAAPTAAVSMNSQRLTNLATPTVATDGATKGYVDAAVNGTDWKQSVRVATTANIATLSGLLTIDGVTLVANDRVLVKDQTTASANGIYVANSGAWARATDADENAEVTAGLAVMVTEGTTNADTQWRLITNDAITVGTTNLTFTQIGAGSSYTQGTGISIAGNVISIDTTVVARKFAATIGDGVATSIVVTHSLNNQDVQTQVRDASTNAVVECDITNNSTTQVTLGFTTAPANNSLRVVVIG
nr:MAG TPA_asm: Capsid decoration protein [Caudoviricetes sp.]